MIVFFLVLIAMDVWILLRTIRAWQMAWQHGIMKANFQKGLYRPGDIVQLAAQDQVSKDSQIRYRVHLNFIDARKRTMGRGKRKRSYLERTYLHAQYQDVSPR